MYEPFFETLKNKKQKNKTKRLIYILYLYKQIF